MDPPWPIRDAFSFRRNSTNEFPKDYWAAENAAAREKLPLYHTVPASLDANLTPALPVETPSTNWSRSHGESGGSRYSGLNQINLDNVKDLEVAWIYHGKDGNGNIQSNPVIADGVLYAPTPGKYIVAVNAETGVEIWRFKPEGRPAFRGLIYHHPAGSDNARILFCAGKFLYSLDAKTGQPVNGFGDHGKALLPGNAQGDFGAATAAPAIFQNIIVVPGFEKDVWGFNLTTGEQLWTFHTLPQPGEFGHETWDRLEKYGANCWGGMAMDDRRGIAYITTGSPKENFIGIAHHGENLFANCLIALDARTGMRLWHFQEIAHDIWDLDMPAPPNLTTITREGRKIDVVAAVTKIGNTVLLDRVTGKPIFPMRFKRAPAGDLRGEETAPYQPDFELPEPFAKMEYSAMDISERTPEVKEFLENRLKSATTGWFRPFSEGKLNLFFGLHGGAEWTGAATDPTSGRLYVSANHIPWIISVFRDDDPPDDPKTPKTAGQKVFEANCAQCHGLNKVGIGTAPPLRGLRHRMDDAGIKSIVRSGKNNMPARPDLSENDVTALTDYLLLRDRTIPAESAKSERPHYTFSGYTKFLDQDGYPGTKTPWGTLNCIDLNTGKIVWRVPLGNHDELKGPGQTGTENFGGAIVTAGGLVFCSGTRDSKIRAFEAASGKEVWSAKLPWTGSAAPSTYEVKGRQYIVIPAMGGGKLGTPTGDAYVAFALPRTK